MIVEIVILAMIAAFLGLRLYSVLGRRAEHEEETAGLARRSQPQAERAIPGRSREVSGPQPQDGLPPGTERALLGVPLAAQDAVRAIAVADRGFQPAAFLEGARSAYAMILEAFWNGDRQTLEQLCDDDVYESFASAIAARQAAGESVENRLIRINEAAITGAEFEAPMARITVSFSADIAALTRDADGNMIAGSLDDAIETHDVWTFSRRVGSTRPDWLLDETDAD